MKNEQIEKLFARLPKRTVALLAAGATLVTLAGCSKTLESTKQPSETPTAKPSKEPTTVSSTLRPLPSGIIFNGAEVELEVEDEKDIATEKPVEGIKTPVAGTKPAPTAPAATVEQVVAEHPNYPYTATITIPLNNGTNPAVSFATSKEAGKETVFISSNTAKVCGVMVTQSLIDTLLQDPSIKVLEFEGCQIDTLNINSTNVNSLYLWNTYVRQIGTCNVGGNFTLTLNHASLGDPSSLRSLSTCTTCTAIGIPSSYLSSFKELTSLQTLTLKQMDIPSYDFVNNTGVKTLYIESCTLGYTPLTSQSLQTFSAFDVDLGDLDFLASSSVQDVNFRSCSFCNLEGLDHSSVLSVKVDGFYTSRTHRNNTFQPELLSFYDDVPYTLDLGL